MQKKNAFSEKELKIVLNSLNNNINKTTVFKTLLHTDLYTFNRCCDSAQINYPTRLTQKQVIYNPFLDINNEDVQYWFGWFASDGSITKHRLSLSVKSTDIDILLKFNKWLGINLHISTIIKDNKYEQSRVCFKNKEIMLFLNELGFTSNKTYTFIPNFEISWPYLRGFFEGDGYFRFNKTKEVSLVSASINHLLKIGEFLTKQLIEFKIYKRIKNRKNPIYYLSILKQKYIKQFIENIYNNANIFLDRKYYNAQAISNNGWKALKFGELALRIPSQASIIEEGVTTLQEPPNR